MTEDEMAGWHHRLNGHEFEKIPGDSEGQVSLVCCSPWGPKESDTTEHPNNKTKKLERARKRILFHREPPGEQRLKSPPATHIVDS